jgi:hypothetical protein
VRRRLLRSHTEVAARARDPKFFGMPNKSTVARAKRDLARGKSPTTAAGEFVRQESEHIRQGKHGARSTKQAIAIGLSEARRAGVPLPPPKKGATSERTRRSAERAYEAGQARAKAGGKPRAPSPGRSRAAERALEREGRGAASKQALSRQAKRAAGDRRRRAAKRGSA